jgi:hypothetical protein
MATVNPRQCETAIRKDRGMVIHDALNSIMFSGGIIRGFRRATVI